MPSAWRADGALENVFCRYIAARVVAMQVAALGADEDEIAALVGGDGGDFFAETISPRPPRRRRGGEEEAQGEEAEGEVFHAVLLWACTRYQNVSERKSAAGIHSWMVYITEDC